MATFQLLCLLIIGIYHIRSSPITTGPTPTAISKDVTEHSTTIQHTDIKIKVSPANDTPDDYIQTQHPTETQQPEITPEVLVQPIVTEPEEEQNREEIQEPENVEIRYPDEDSFESEDPQPEILNRNPVSRDEKETTDQEAGTDFTADPNTPENGQAYPTVGRDTFDASPSAGENNPSEQEENFPPEVSEENQQQQQQEESQDGMGAGGFPVNANFPEEMVDDPPEKQPPPIVMIEDTDLISEEMQDGPPEVSDSEVLSVPSMLLEDGPQSLENDEDEPINTL